MSKIIIDIYKGYKLYNVNINYENFYISTPYGKKHARKIALEEYKKKYQPIIYSVEEEKS